MSPRKLLAALAADGLDMSGWTIEHTNGGHWRLIGPAGERVFASSTSSERRMRKVIAGDIRRAHRTAIEQMRGRS